MLQLGAVVTLGVDEDTTHVVAAARNTDKVHWAAAHNRHIVSPAWLHACGQCLLSCSQLACFGGEQELTTSLNET